MPRSFTQHRRPVPLWLEVQGAGSRTARRLLFSASWTSTYGRPMDVNSDVQLTSVGASSSNPSRAQIIVGAVVSEKSCLDVRWTSKFRPLSLQSRRYVRHVVARPCACASQHQAACAQPAQAALIRSERTPRSTGGSKQLMRSWGGPSVITTLIPSQERATLPQQDPVRDHGPGATAPTCQTSPIRAACLPGYAASAHSRLSNRRLLFSH